MNMQCINEQQIANEQQFYNMEFHVDEDFVLGTEVVLASEGQLSPLGGPDHENCVLIPEVKRVLTLVSKFEKMIQDDCIEQTIDSEDDDEKVDLFSSEQQEDDDDLSPNTRKSLEAELKELEDELTSIRSELSEIGGQSSPDHSPNSSSSAPHDDTDAEEVVITSANMGRRCFSRSVTPAFSGVAALLKNKMISEDNVNYYPSCCTDSEPEHEVSPCHGHDNEDEIEIPRMSVDIEDANPLKSILIEHKIEKQLTVPLAETPRQSVDIEFDNPLKAIISEQKKNAPRTRESLTKGKGKKGILKTTRRVKTDSCLDFPMPATAGKYRYSSALTVDQIEEHYARTQEEENMDGRILPRQTVDIEDENPLKDVIIQHKKDALPEKETHFDIDCPRQTIDIEDENPLKKVLVDHKITAMRNGDISPYPSRQNTIETDAILPRQSVDLEETNPLRHVLIDQKAVPIPACPSVKIEPSNPLKAVLVQHKLGDMVDQQNHNQEVISTLVEEMQGRPRESIEIELDSPLAEVLASHKRRDSSLDFNRENDVDHVQTTPCQSVEIEAGNIPLYKKMMLKEQEHKKKTFLSSSALGGSKGAASPVFTRSWTVGALRDHPLFRKNSDGIAKARSLYGRSSIDSLENIPKPGAVSNNLLLKADKQKKENNDTTNQEQNQQQQKKKKTDNKKKNKNKNKNKKGRK